MLTLREWTKLFEEKVKQDDEQYRLFGERLNELIEQGYGDRIIYTPFELAALVIGDNNA